MNKFTLLAGTAQVKRRANELIRAACAARDPLAFVAVCCIGGERVYNCDEAVCLVAEEGGEPRVVGLATIAPRGECGDGEAAEIVGLYILDSHRGKGLGPELFARAVARCKERRDGHMRADGTHVTPEPTFARVRVSCVTKLGAGVVQKHLATHPKDAPYLEVRDMSNMSPW